MIKNKVLSMLFLCIAASALLVSSCSNNEGDDDLYIVTTYSMADYYFKPKKLNLMNQNGHIYGNWLFNKNIESSQSLREVYDYGQEYADHYYFLSDPDVRKYAEWNNATNKEVFIDTNDIQSPYKEYAKYFGDTLLRTSHCEWPSFNECTICVLPITGVDVWCDKDFDSEHPAGSNLNDIMYWPWPCNHYGALHKRDENGELFYKGKSFYQYSSSDDWFLKDKIPLTDFPKHPLLMSGHRFSIPFNHTPLNPGTYEFTVKITFGPDPLSGEIVELEPAKVNIEF